MKCLLALALLLTACGDPPREPPPETPADTVAPAPDTLPPAPADTTAVPDLAADLEAALDRARELEAIIDSLRGLPPDTTTAACSICATAGLGWMCMLPAGDPYDG